MWQNLHTLMALLFTRGKEHKHEVEETPINILKLRRKLEEAEQKLLTLKEVSSVTSTELIQVRTELTDATTQSNLWMKESATLQDKLSASLGHVTVLENVLEESNKTIEALTLAMELREKEETEGLHNYIDELEIEMEEAVGLIQKYGLELRKA